MNAPKYAACAIIFIFLACAVVGYFGRQSAKADNRFARDCNERGGMAQIIDGMRQCLRARSLP